jgi:hypothetical protein
MHLYGLQVVAAPVIGKVVEVAEARTIGTILGGQCTIHWPSCWVDHCSAVVKYTCIATKGGKLAFHEGTMLRMRGSILLWRPVHTNHYHWEALHMHGRCPEAL